MEIVLASSNTQKVLQLRQMLKGLTVKATILSLFDFQDYEPPPYDPHLTIQENALNKAKVSAAQLKKCCLAEQWQLVIPPLGIIAKDLFDSQSIALQTKKILKALGGKKEHERTAYLESCIAVVTPEGKERHATGRTEGFIAEEERGKSNYDFDSIFVKHDYMKTLAELSPSVRDRISHRLKALEKLLGFIETS